VAKRTFFVTLKDSAASMLAAEDWSGIFLKKFSLKKRSMSEMLINSAGEKIVSLFNGILPRNFTRFMQFSPRLKRLRRGSGAAKAPKAPIHALDEDGFSPKSGN